MYVCTSPSLIHIRNVMLCYVMYVCMYVCMYVVHRKLREDMMKKADKSKEKAQRAQKFGWK